MDDWEWTNLTLFRKPLSTLAAFTDRDLGMRMGFSRITVGKKRRWTATKKRESEREKGTIVSREEDDSQSNLPVGDHICCVGVKGWEEIQRTVFSSFSHFSWSTHSLGILTSQQCHTNENKNTTKIVLPSKLKSKDVVLFHRAILHSEEASVFSSNPSSRLPVFVLIQTNYPSEISYFKIR